MNDGLKMMINCKLCFFKEHVNISLIVICVVAFLSRLYFSNFENPFTFDALGYFLYAMDININDQLPSNYAIGNNGWPIFLSGFLSLFKFNSVLAYMETQRLLTIILSSLTIIPIYFFCKKFFGKSYSLLGAIIFAVEPRIILNSSLGITEPLYILLGTIVLVFFLSDNKKLVYASFAITALTSMIRTEGLFLFFAVSFMFFFRFKNDKRIILKYFLACLIFVLVLFPMSYYRIETMGHDALTQRIINGFYGHVLGSDHFSEKVLSEINGNTQASFFERGAQNFVMYLIWDLIPIFIFFVPFSIYFLLKDRNFRNVTIIVTTIFMCIPAFYAYSIPLQDTRYLFFLYPLFSVLSLFTIKKFAGKFNNQNYVIGLIFLGIVIASSVFLSYKHSDIEHEKESFLIAKIFTQSEKGINAYLPESGYIESASIPDNFSVFESYYHQKREKGVSIRSSFPQKVTIISVNDYVSLDAFIQDSKFKGLTHIAVDENPKRPEFLKDVFYNETKYPYLIKEFDSANNGFRYHIKLFKIDYDLFQK